MQFVSQTEAEPDSIQLKSVAFLYSRQVRRAYFGQALHENIAPRAVHKPSVV